MEFKGTKGPWMVNPEHQNYNGNKAMEINYGKDGECVAEIVHNKHDAQLISKAPELFEMLNAAKYRLGSLRRSMTVHPDCVEGSEFDDLTDIAQELEDEIEALLKEATTI